jgi:hypothetical protein
VVDIFRDWWFDRCLAEGVALAMERGQMGWGKGERDWWSDWRERGGRGRLRRRDLGEDESTPRSELAMEILHWVVVTPMISDDRFKDIFIFFKMYVLSSGDSRGSARCSESWLVHLLPNSGKIPLQFSGIDEDEQDSSSLIHVTFLLGQCHKTRESHIGGG